MAAWKIGGHLTVISRAQKATAGERDDFVIKVLAVFADDLGSNPSSYIR